MSGFTENWLPNIATHRAMFIAPMYYGPEKARESMDRLVQRIGRRRSRDTMITPNAGLITSRSYGPLILVEGTTAEHDPA